jgi:hypothetical protein
LRSATSDLAAKHANDFRAVMRFFRRRSSARRTSENEIELTLCGFRLSTSVGGLLTGRCGDLVTTDDV